LMQQHPTPMLLYLMVAAQGFLGYGCASVYGSVTAELFQGRHYGAISGMLSVAGNLGAGLGPWLTGVLYDRMGNYTFAFVVAMSMSFLSIACVWIAAPRKVRVVAGQIERLRAQRQLQGQE